MIRAVWPASELSATGVDGAGRRIIDGVAVPWEIPGRVESGDTVIFHQGSLDASSRPVALRDHDRSRPIGRVVDAADRGDALTAAIRVARTREGDEALILAAPPDQVLGMLSVGVDPTDYSYDLDGVLHVYAGDWQELSLLTIGAYDGARVANVAATQPGGTHMPPDTALDDPVTPAEPEPLEPDEPDDESPPAVQAARPGRRPAAAPATIPLRGQAAAATPEPLDLTRYARIISAGMRRQLQAAGIQSQIRAALTNVATTDVAGIVRPAYRAELVGLIDHGMPVVRALQQRPLPPSGMTIEYPRWTALPDSTAIQATQKTQIGSGDVTITVVSDDVETWSQGNDISFQTVNRSDPSFIEAYLRAAAVDAGRKYDTYVINQLLTAAQAATAGADFLANVKALFAALNPASVPPGPLFLALAYDVGLDLIDVTEMNGPAYWDLSINLGSFMPEQTSGLTVFTDWNMPAGSYLLGSRLGAASYGGPDTSADIRVVDVSLLGIDIGVYFYATPAIEYPAAFAKITTAALMSHDDFTVEGQAQPVKAIAKKA